MGGVRPRELHVYAAVLDGRRDVRPSPLPRLRVEKKGSNRKGSTSAAIGAPSLATDSTASLALRACRRTRSACG